MKAVLISIQPKWCEKIANGQKTIEVRKTRPKIETPFKVYIYHTKTRNAGGDDWNHWADCWQLPNGKFVNAGGKVIGEGICNKIDIYLDKVIYGWHISDLKIYDKLKELSEFKKSCPPRSWYYVEELE